MAKKRLSYIFVFLLFIALPAALASTEEGIYSGTVQSGQVIEAKDYKFEIKVVGTVGASVRYDSRSFLVMASECEWDGNLKFCIGTPTFSHRNSETWEDIYQVTVMITLKKGFDINKSVEHVRLLIGEKTKVEMLLLNDGAFPLENVAYKESYPPELKVTAVEGCFLSNNALEWYGTLGSKSKQTCTYELIAMKGIEYTSQAEAGYYDGKEKQKAYSNKVKIRVQNYSLKVTPSVNVTKQGIGGKVDVSLALENLYRGELIVRTFEINIPVGLVITKNSNALEKKAQLMLWKGTLARDEKQNFTFNLNAEKTGNFTIQLREKYTEGPFERIFVKSLNLTIDCDCLIIQHKLSRKDNNQAHLRVYVFNPSYENQFNDITVDVTTNIPGAGNIPGNYKVLLPRDTILLFNDKITITPKGRYYYDVGISYESDYRQHFKDIKSIVIEGEPAMPMGEEIEPEEESASINATELGVTDEMDEELEASLQQPETVVETLTPTEKKGIIAVVLLLLIAVGILVAVVYKKMST